MTTLGDDPEMGTAEAGSSSWWLAIVGAVGLSLDLAFHWVSAGFEGTIDGSFNPVTVLNFLQTLLIDVDPRTVPLWATMLGVAAHTMFLTGFMLLVFMALKDKFRRKPKDESGIRQQTRSDLTDDLQAREGLS
ncbi:MAG TPA: hypothetical protein VFA17_00925 [Thermoplasmata archaeon]|jgi:hypothetical protein|nr:hypothetical protein [Thermoplasmata archaeon]